MKVKVIFSQSEANGSKGGCAGGICPTIYETDRNTYLVQGYVVKNTDLEELSFPEGETVVEIPKDFLDKYKVK